MRDEVENSSGCLQAFTWFMVAGFFGVGSCFAIGLVSWFSDPPASNPPAANPSREPWTPRPQAEPYEPPPIKPTVVLPEPIVFRYRSEDADCPVTIDVVQVMDLASEEIRIRARFRATREVRITSARSGWAEWNGLSDLRPDWTWELPQKDPEAREFPPENDLWVVVVDGFEFELRLE